MKKLCAIVAMLVSASAAQAAAPTLKTKLSAEGVFNSHPLMSRQNAQDLWGNKTSLRLGLDQNLPTTAYDIAGWVDNNLYNRGRFNSVDFGGEANLQSHTQRLETALALKGSYDTTLTREISDVGVMADKAVRRTIFEGAPKISYAVSQRGVLGLEGSARLARYKGDTFTDYHTLSASPSYAYSFTERFTGLLGGQYRRYEADSGIDHTVDSAGPFVGFISNLTERLKLQARYGHEASRHKVAGVTGDWDWNYVYAADLTYKSELSELTLGGMRAQQSYASGRDALLTTIYGQARYKFDPYITLQGTLRYQFANSDSPVWNDIDRVYTGRAGLFYHLTKTLDLTAAYSYRNEKIEGVSKAAQRHEALFGLAWNPEIAL